MILLLLVQLIKILAYIYTPSILFKALSLAGAVQIAIESGISQFFTANLLNLLGAYMNERAHTTIYILRSGFFRPRTRLTGLPRRRAVAGEDLPRISAPAILRLLSRCLSRRAEFKPYCSRDKFGRSSFEFAGQQASTAQSLQRSPQQGSRAAKFIPAALSHIQTL